MSTFRPTREKRVCALNFDDKFCYELSLHEETLQKITSISDKQVKALEAIRPDNPNALNDAYNMTLDALDEILGEGAGADIMSLYDKPSLFDVADVITYIGDEYRAAFAEQLGEQKAVGINRDMRRGRR